MKNKILIISKNTDIPNGSTIRIKGIISAFITKQFTVDHKVLEVNGNFIFNKYLKSE